MAIHGGGGGGGLVPGTWTIVASGVGSVNQGTTQDAMTVAIAPGATTHYFARITPTVMGNAICCNEGSVIAAPGTTAVQYAWISDGSILTLRIRTGASTGTFGYNYLVFKIVY